MTSSAEEADSRADLLDVLAEEFVSRYRRGERPSTVEYEEEHPDLASKIRLLFPALVELEQAGSAPPAAAVRPAVPGRIGEFRLLRLIGVGGMGVVYEASQESLGRRVALKVLPIRGLASSPERFLREARTAARLHHTNIVPVFSVGESDGVHYYAMQFIDGPSLAQILDASRVRRGAGEGAFAHTRWAATGQDGSPSDFPGPSSEPTLDGLHWAELDGPRSPQAYRDLARLTARVASALAYAHDQGVLHRDIKPSNILLDAQGTPWVVDFGLAKSADDEDLTHTGDLVGTLRYMAPERFRGRADARADVYSLGATLYEILCLRPAFQAGDRVALIDAICRGRPTRPRAIDARIPRDLETICLKAMAREPGERYATALEFEADLESFLADQPIRARRATLADRARRWWRRDPAEASLAAAVAVLLVALAAGLVAFAAWAERARENAVLLSRQASDAEVERTRQLARSLADRARAGRTSRRPGQRFASLDAIREAVALGRRTGEPPEFFDDLRNQAIASLALPDIRLGPPANWGMRPQTTFRFDGAMQILATSGLDGAIRLRRVDGSPIATLAGYPGEQDLRLDEAGKLLAARSSSGGLRAWDLAGGSPTPAVDLREGVVAHDIRPDGGELAVATRDGGISLVSPVGGDVVRSWRVEGRAGHVAYSPDGLSLAIPLSEGIAIHDAASGGRRTLLPESASVPAIAWHPGGEYLATHMEARIAVWDIRRREVVQTCNARSASWAIAFTRDGLMLASGGWDGLWRLHDPAGGQLTLVAGLVAGREFGLGNRLAMGPAGAEMGIAEVMTGSECRSLFRLGGTLATRDAIAIHPDGRLLAVAWGSHVGLWDLADGRIVADLPRPARHLVFSRRGDLFTHGQEGLYRWRVRLDPDGSLRVVGPEKLTELVPGGDLVLAATNDGRLLAASFAAGIGVIETDRPVRVTWLGPQSDVRCASFSPDGRLVAVASWHGGRGVCVYESTTGRPLVDFPAVESTSARFSPDGRWLAVTTNGLGRLRRVPDWSPGLAIDGVVNDFSNDGLIATTTIEGAIRLTRTDSGRQVARLEPPDMQRVYDLAFSPDGSRLVVRHATDNGLYVWDLRAIRRQLAELGLDWDAPPLPSETLPLARPIRVLEPSPGLAGGWPVEEACAILGALRRDASAEDFERLARIAQRYRAFDVALGCLDRAAALRPHRAETHSDRGRILLRHRLDAAAAAAAYGRAAEIDPSWWRARLGRAEAMIAASRGGDVLAELKAMCAERPWDFAARTLMSAALVEAGRHAEALSMLDSILAAYPSNQLARHWRARALEALGDPTRAQLDEPGTRSPLAANDLAWSWVAGPIELRNPELALPMARHAVASAPGDAAYRNTLGLTLHRLGRDAEAVAELRESLRLGQGADLAFDLYPLALAHWRLGDRSVALAEFLRGLAWHAFHRSDLTASERDELFDLLLEASLSMLKPAASAIAAGKPVAGQAVRPLP
ncbi:serine/threonine-protein kinase [Aquisphaera insulae]|uniref:serine/threonine-protein kinase n=1 Tax=Aquisphaera insulae TaxID=2712864 RepID=UPI0013EC3C9A|nr:serine/threonine-protein kinase [Aquisphaera insulae]